MSQETSAFVNQLKDFAAGAAGGIALVLAGHPLDTLKVRLQTSGQDGGPKFNGLMDACTKTLKNEGIGGFYKGIASPLVGVAAMNATLFWAWNVSRNLVKTSEDEVLSIPKLFVAGFMTGFAVSFVESPVDLIKSKMQIQYTKGGSTLSCALGILKDYGIRGLYQGFGSTLLRNIPANASYFVGYEVFRRELSGDVNNTTLSPMATLVAGGIGGLAYWTFSFPMDVNKSRMQTDSSDHTLRKYKHSWDCIKQLAKAEGFKGFWKGYSPCLIRAFPANAVCFFTYELVRQMLGQ
eukprot:TRINITY_DN728_c0_g1_i2.p1 TRINITY_DN728_c0_g1~~TRINITY_DN728_c0_g1_i2.p1  ORF type:complete len:293 (-),score=70.07 TRINITY_DN728_c0_g1_i2:18-896(-)